MKNSLKNDVKYLNNIDLVHSWDLFQESACCLKDLYTDKNYGHKNLPNFIKTIKSVESFYKNSVDVLLKKRKRYVEIGYEKERLKLLKWFLLNGKQKVLDKKNLLRRIYKKRLLRDKSYIQHMLNSSHSQRRRQFEIYYNGYYGNSNETSLSNYDYYHINSANNYLSNHMNVNVASKQTVDIFNDAVNLQSLQGDLSEFALAPNDPIASDKII